MTVISRRCAGRVAVLIAVMVLLAACTRMPSIGRESRSNAFEAAVITYTKLIRWGYFEEAVKYLRAQDGAQIPYDLNKMARYRVTAYKNINQIQADNGREGRVLALIEYYEIDSGVLKTLRDEQFWWHDDDAKRWYLGSPLPDFGRVDEQP